MGAPGEQTEMATPFGSNSKSLPTRMLAAGVKTLRHLSLIAVALFLLVAISHAQTVRRGGACSSDCTTNNNCLLVSDYNNSQVLQYDTSGTICSSMFLNGYTGGGGGAGGEGLACVGAGSTGQLVTSNNDAQLNVFNLKTGTWDKPDSISVAGADFTALDVNALGTELYVADDGGGNLYRFSFNPLSKINSVGTKYKHDVSVGYSGLVFATDFFPPVPPGVEVYNPDLSGGTNFIPNSCWTFTHGDGKSHCASSLSGMAWDSAGNLWVSDDTAPPDGNGFFEFAVSPTGQLLNGGVPLNFVPDVNGSGCGVNHCLPIGITVVPAGAPHAGNILAANFLGDNLVLIDPSTCTGNLTNGGLGTCNLSVFFNGPPNSAPKYPVYTQSCPNDVNTGYIEICKAANTQFPPPTQLYDFTITGPFFNSGPIQVPLGDCSGPIQVPAATLPNTDTITETGVLGVLVSDVTAIAYNSLGMEINQLGSWTLPDLNATVGVQAGDVSLETLATFTNYAVGQDGQLKICKIAGQPGVLNQPFMFTVTDPLGQQQYQIEAGPPDQGGYCVLADQFPVNTQVTVAETLQTNFPLSNITVQCNGCTYTTNLPQGNVVTTIGAGITEVDFTNITNATGPGCPAGNVVYSDGPVDGNTDAWTINFGYLVSDSFTVAARSVLTNLCFYAWLTPGDTLLTVEASITSMSLNSGTSYFDKPFDPTTCTLYCSAGPNCGMGQYNVYSCVAPLGVVLNSGNYWLNLQNAVPSNNNDPAYWDENSGPSMAEDNSVGTIPAESFEIFGNGLRH